MHQFSFALISYKFYDYSIVDIKHKTIFAARMGVVSILTRPDTDTK